MGQNASSQRHSPPQQLERRPQSVLERPQRLRPSPRPNDSNLATGRSSGVDSEWQNRRRSWMGLRRMPGQGLEQTGRPRPASVAMSGPSGLTFEEDSEDAPHDDLSPAEAAVTRGTFAAWVSRQRYTSSETTNGDERRQDTRAVRRRLSNRFGFSRGLPGNAERNTSRLSTFGRRSDDHTSRSPSTRERIGSISRPLPYEPPSWDLREGESSDDHDHSNHADSAADAASTPRHRTPSSSGRESRFARVRNSLLLPMSNLFQHREDRPSEVNNEDFDSRDQLRSSFEDEDATGRPGSRRPTYRDTSEGGRSSSLFAARPRSRHARHRSDGATRGLANERQVRQLPGPFRRNSPRHHQGGEDQAVMLSRLLSVAAAATAASLVGDTGQAFSQAQDVGDNGPDGSFDGFLHALRNGSLAAALRNGGRETNSNTPETPAGDGELSPVNFFRMFRFGTVNEDGSAVGGQGRNVYGGETGPTADTAHELGSEEGNGEAATGRMVPVIIVGIRSVTPRTGNRRTQEDGSTTPPLFDAFSNLPLTLSRGGSGTMMRRTDRRSRFSRTRRSSSSATNFFGSGQDAQRQQQSQQAGTGTQRGQMDSTMPTVLSDTPPGPHPPPSTPADHALSAFSSGNSTPSRRPSSASAASPPSLANNRLPSWRDGAATRSTATNLSSTAEEGPPPTARARRRRMSDSEFARYRDLGSGSSRRNGIVGDSELDAQPAQPGANNVNGNGNGSGTPNEEPRSWIIYVLGGSYPEEHPILTTPSLFTDSPTYEDMLLISSLVGPAKPPVASREDVAAAPGIYKISLSEEAGGKLIALAQNAAVSNEGDDNGDQARLELLPGEHCLVCLCGYNVDEEARRLVKCKHMFHRECIDEWLTTGRNSCPLCRAQGVEGRSAAQRQGDAPPPPPPPPPPPAEPELNDPSTTPTPS